MFALGASSCASGAGGRGSPGDAPRTRDLAAAVAAANAVDAAAGPWSMPEIETLDAIRVERYQIAGGPTLILAIDEWAPALVIDTWLPRQDLDAALTERVYEGLRQRAQAASAVTASQLRAAISPYWLMVGELVVSPTGCGDRSAAAIRRAIHRLSEPLSPLRPQRRELGPSLRARLEIELEAGRARPTLLDPLSAAITPWEQVDPRRLHIIAVGKLDRLQVLSVLRQALPASTPPPSAPRSVETSTRTHEIALPTDRTWVLAAWHLRDARPADLAGIEALAHLLAERPPGIFDAITLETSLTRSTPVPRFDVLLGLPPTVSATKAVERVERALPELVAGGGASLPLGRIKAQLVARHLEDLDELGDRSTTLAMAELFGRGVASLAEELRAIDQLTTSGLEGLARSLLGPATRAVVIARPAGGAP
ncbi:MAG: hypothetical protein IT384_07240 [Deltaproteobacteria bacterium]|nr:hypothetical protein [Deltaproteobacteria bacterium]